MRKCYKNPHQRNSFTMRFKFVSKVVLKTGVLITLIVFIVVQMLGTIINVEIEPGEDSPDYSELVKSESGGRENDVDLANADPVDINQLNEEEKNQLYSLRYWDLVKSNDSSHKMRTQPLLKEKIDFLWRPINGQPGPEDYDKFVPQLVWQMEAAQTTFKRFKPKTILVWDGLDWWSKQTWKKHSPKQLNAGDCHHTPNSLDQCVFTDNHDDLHFADAVIATRDLFHMGEVKVPEKVLKFYFILESPFHAWAYLNRTEDLLASFWRGSDLLTPYSKWVYYNPKVKAKKSDENHALGKSKPVAAFISNCDGWNNRMGYINELKKYIQIDVYGSCGEFKCSKFNDECFEMLQNDYYFYLAFENSNCRDYITEKFFTNALQNNVIPIVLGAHPEDYRKLAPEKSYIHVEDFASPKELGEHLQNLMKNPQEYNSHFEWKGTGEFISSELFCRLCAMVHYADLVPPPKRTKAFRWGHMQAIKSGMCLPRDQWYWERSKEKEGKDRIEQDALFDELSNGLNTLYGS